MKTFFLIITLGALALPCIAQDEKVDNFVDVDKMEPAAQKTPDYNVKGVTEKKWRAKEWLEIEVPFEVTRAPRAAAKSKDLKYISELTFKYYVFIKAGKGSKVLTAEVKHVSIPIKEKMASVVYVSPQALEQLMNKKRVTGAAKLVSLMGVEVFHSGTKVGMWSSTGKGKAWWDGEKAPAKEAGKLLPKSKTPFAPLWGDYHAVEG